MTKYTRPDLNGGPFAPEIAGLVSMEQILAGKLITVNGLRQILRQTDCVDGARKLRTL